MIGYPNRRSVTNHQLLIFRPRTDSRRVLLHCNWSYDVDESMPIRASSRAASGNWVLVCPDCLNLKCYLTVSCFANGMARILRHVCDFWNNCFRNGKIVRKNVISIYQVSEAPVKCVTVGLHCVENVCPFILKQRQNLSSAKNFHLSSCRVNPRHVPTYLLRTPSTYILYCGGFSDTV